MKNLYNLTKRELEIVELLSWGFCDKEIGQKLNISARTVQTHVARMMVKTCARNRTAVVGNYFRSMLVQEWA